MEDNNQNIFGIRAIIEAINSGKEIEKVFLIRDAKGNLMNELNHLIREHKITTSYVPIEKLNKLSKFQNHQGAVARISAISFVDLETLIETNENKNPLYLLLDHITDVRNFGAMIRTAECTKVDGIVIASHGSAPLNEDAIKTSAGAAFNIPIAKVDHIKDAVFLLQAANIKVVAITEKTDNLIYDLELNTPLAIILGSEDKGINPSIIKASNEKAKLPLYGTIASLNVSVACGVALYEITRQRL